MSATERVAALGSRSTISGWAAISPFQKSSRFAHHRVHRRLDYPASLGLDLLIARLVAETAQAASSRSLWSHQAAAAYARRRITFLITRHIRLQNHIRHVQFETS